MGAVQGSGCSGWLPMRARTSSNAWPCASAHLHRDVALHQAVQQRVRPDGACIGQADHERPHVRVRLRPVTPLRARTCMHLQPQVRPHEDVPCFLHYHAVAYAPKATAICCGACATCTV